MVISRRAFLLGSTALSIGVLARAEAARAFLSVADRLRTGPGTTGISCAAFSLMMQGATGSATSSTVGTTACANGTSWAANTSLVISGNNPGGLAWNGMSFICAGYGAGSGGAYSNSGTSWTAFTFQQATTYLGRICWGRSLWVIVPGYGGGTGGDAMVSPDGLNWTTQALPVSSYWMDIAYNGTVFCMIAGGGNSYAATSPDGTTWTQQTLPAGANWARIKWNGTVFCVIAGAATGRTDLGSHAATSPNGTTWTLHSGALPSNKWGGLAWNGTVFCATQGYSTGGGGGGNSFCATSPDGTTWTTQALPGSYVVPDIAWNGTSFAAPAMNTSLVLSSPDGTSWTTYTLPYSNKWAAIAAQYLQWGTY